MIYLLLPAYNEEKSLASLLTRIAGRMEAFSREYRIIVVDDGSTDGTGHIIRNLARSLPISAITHPVNRGVGAVFNSGLQEICRLSRDAEDVVITMEADNTSDLGLIEEMIEKIAREGYDAVCASRYCPGGGYCSFPPFRLLLSLVANRLLRRCFPIRGVKDYTIFYRAYKGSILRKAFECYGDRFIENRGFVSNAEILVKLRPLLKKCGEVPFLYRYDLKGGASKLRIGLTLLEYLRFISRQLKKDFKKRELTPFGGRIKILHLTTDSRIGGTEKNIISLVSRLDRDRYENIVVALLPGGELVDILRGRGIETESLGMRNKFDLPAIFRLSRVIREKRVDILHTYLFHANMLGRIVGRLAGVPVIISSLRVMERRRYHLWLDRWTSGMVGVETCVCEAVRKYTIEKARIRPDKLVTIPNGIAPEEYPLSMDLDNKRKELGIDSGFPILGTVGRLHEQKGQVYLLRAMPTVLKKYPKAVLLMVGDGPLKSKLESLCCNLRITKSVKFLGFKKNIKELMALMEVFILPSLWEGMPNVLLEAMVLGKPVIATRVGGAEELIEDGVTGLLVPPFAEEALAEAMMKVLTRDDKGRGLGETAKREVERRFPPEAMVKETEKLYERLLSLDYSKRAGKVNRVASGDPPPTRRGDLGRP